MNGTQQDKSNIVSNVTQALFKIDKDEAQALPDKDIPTASMYEKVHDWLHRKKQAFQRIFAKRGSRR